LGGGFFGIAQKENPAGVAAEFAAAGVGGFRRAADRLHRLGSPDQYFAIGGRSAFGKRDRFTIRCDVGYLMVSRKLREADGLLGR
jgi:hypothetical protein